MAENQNVQNNAPELDISEQSRIRREKLADLCAAGNDPYVITKYDRTHHSADIKDNFEALENTTVSIAGRLMSKRVMGKASSAASRI